MQLRRENFKMVSKLGVIVLGMFAFGYALVPIYKAICEMTGINVLALGDRQIPGVTSNLPANTQVDRARTVTVEFDANSRGAYEEDVKHLSLLHVVAVGLVGVMVFVGVLVLLVNWVVAA